MKPYQSGAARLRAIYQVPTPPGRGAVLELHTSDGGRVVDDQWPADVLVSCRLASTVSHPWSVSASKARPHTCDASYDEPLPFAPGSFDMVILHRTLDGLASACRQRRPRQVADDWLRQVASTLRPGGLVVGCCRNRTSPRSWFSRSGAASSSVAQVTALSVASCGKALLKAGFCKPRVFNLLPDSENPRSLAAVEASTSKRAFRHALDATRGSVNLPGYLVRLLVVELALNRFVEENVFFWGYKPC